MNTLAKMIIASGGLSLVLLLVLHFLSPEFKPSWRMISEYANGKHKGVLTAFFLLWGLSTLMLPVLLWGDTTSIWAKVGLVLVFLSGVGACMGGLFDIKHPLHGAAFGLGIPTLPIGALLVSYHLANKQDWSQYASAMTWSAHSIWVSVILMAAAMVVMMSGFKAAGVAMGPDAKPPEEVPANVIAWAGYFNRLLVICYAAWVILMAKVYLSLPHNT